MKMDGSVDMKKNKFLIPDGPHCFFGEHGKANYRPCPYWNIYIEDDGTEYIVCEFLSMENEHLLFQNKCCFVNLEYEYDE